MGKPDEDIVEKAFVVRSYGKGELASMYIDGVQQQTAVKQFNEWIRTAPGLEQQLQETGMAPTDTHRPRAGTTPACHGHEPLLPTVHARTSAAHHRGAGNTMTPCFAE